MNCCPLSKGHSIERLYNAIDPLMEFNPLNINITYHQQEVVYKKIDHKLDGKKGGEETAGDSCHFSGH